MESKTYFDLFELIKTYSYEEFLRINKAYKIASEAHAGQKRQSGEDYITHPVNVAYILAEIMADSDTICAALLHDTIEDTYITKEFIAEEFNDTIADLVDGVSKINNESFSSFEDERNANIHKLITSIKTDIRIIIIKLADRLHNMRTLEYKTSFKQKNKALETLEIYSPLAEKIGAYRIKKELEDLSLKFLKPDIYNEIAFKRDRAIEENMPCLIEMQNYLNKVLEGNEIPNEIRIRFKNIYGIYLNNPKGMELEKIHDLMTLQILVDSIKNCYLALMYTHRKYPLYGCFKDYISKSKTNLYQSLHTTVFGENNHLVQAQIRTFAMANVASFGLTAYWRTEKNDASLVMQKELSKHLQFYESLTKIDDLAEDNKEFVELVEKELLATNVYVRTMSGEIIELPIGSTPIDFAYKIHSDIGNSMSTAIVNGEEVPFDYVLKNDDRVEIITLENGRDSFSDDMISYAKTGYARKRMRDFNDSKN